MTEQRPVNGFLAAIGNLVGFGLGYVYLGEMRLAVGFIFLSIGAMVAVGVSGLMLNPMSLYVGAAILLLIPIGAILHAFWLAHRRPVRTRRSYNRKWVYVIWFAAGAAIQGGDYEWRGRWFGYDHFRVPATSMAPTVLVGDVITVNTRKRKPTHADLVVFDRPGTDSVKYLKRVVGIPGDVIEVVADRVIRNGVRVQESYLEMHRRGRRVGKNQPPITLGTTQYFVLGDNRANSVDSRYFGPIEESALYGHVVHRWFSFYDGDVRWERFPDMLDASNEE